MDNNNRFNGDGEESSLGRNDDGSAFPATAQEDLTITIRVSDREGHTEPIVHEEASLRLSVSTYATRRLIKAKLLRALRLGKRVLVPQSEIDRVIALGCGKHADSR
jgi:excisionase family DNA binding protein